jgi:hypothetical protein
MGQYHLIVNLDKREFIHPHILGSGLKLQEIIGTLSGPAQALVVLLAASNGRGSGDLAEDPIIGRWAGDRIAIVGDYAEDTDLDASFSAESIYSLCLDEEDEERNYRDISLEVARILERELRGRYEGTGWRNFIPDPDSPFSPQRAQRPDMLLSFYPTITITPAPEEPSSE